MRCQCLARYIDPQTRLVEAAYGWLSERDQISGTYWVSLDANKPPRYFNTQEAAREFFHVMAETRANKEETHAHKTGPIFIRSGGS